MPLGMEGELWIGGIGVAKGYLHAPDLTKEVVRLPHTIYYRLQNVHVICRTQSTPLTLILTLALLPLTAQKFFANPFGAGRVYRTGDIVVQMGVRTPFIRRLNSITVSSMEHSLCSSSSEILWALFSSHLNSFGQSTTHSDSLCPLLQGAEGDYVFIRRMDEQVKIDGFRIELAEIEAVFMTHDLVQKAGTVITCSSSFSLPLHLSSDKDSSSFFFPFYFPIFINSPSHTVSSHPLSLSHSGFSQGCETGSLHQGSKCQHSKRCSIRSGAGACGAVSDILYDAEVSM